MEKEQIKIESVNNYIGKVKKVMLIAIVIAIISVIISPIIGRKGQDYWIKAFRISEKSSFSYIKEDTEDYKEYKDCMSKSDTYSTIATIGTGITIISGIVAIISIALYFYARKMRIVVTDKRVYGQAHFGKQVDLPFDSISAISKSMLKGIAVATSSGRIMFILISNRDEIYQIISELLIERQDIRQEKKEVVKVSSSNADELKKYKELLDTGVITQEEFDAKKKQLLGL